MAKPRSGAKKATPAAKKVKSAKSGGVLKSASKRVAKAAAKLVAKATVKLQKAGAFKTLTISNIQAGEDEDSLGPADGERAYVYQLIDRTLTIVSNMDEAREQPPTLDTYKKVSDAK